MNDDKVRGKRRGKLSLLGGTIGLALVVMLA